VNTIRLDSRIVGDGQPCFIIAEAGVNHNGDIKLAEKLIDAAKESGADAVKFQTFITEEIITSLAEKADYQKETTGNNETQFDMIKRLELSAEDFQHLYEYSMQRSILFLSTPDDFESVDMLDKLGVIAFKIGSGEITNFPHLKHIAEKMKPVILSTGMSTLSEVDEAVRVIKLQGNGDLILLHCVTDYPAKYEDVNLKAMVTLKKVFKVPVGLSDHTLGINIPIAAVSLGACVIEKHLTIDKTLPGPDHSASLEPNEFKQMVNAIREVEQAIGSGVKQPTKAEVNIARVVRRSLVARTDIPAGVVIQPEMLAIKRPAGGIEPKYYDVVLGSLTRKEIQKDNLLKWEDIQAN
jgi:N-acetylneuraminate synthase/N,N'-diacetyllegionaminate synthase